MTPQTASFRDLRKNCPLQLEFQRHGQFYVDFVESENSNGFHAPQESARILGEAIDYLRQRQLALRPALESAPPSAARR